MNEREWHYVHERSREGPVAESVLRSRLESAELPMDVLVWSDASADWVPANEEPTFQDVEVCPRCLAPSPPAAVPPPRAVTPVPAKKPATKRASTPTRPATPMSPMALANIYIGSAGIEHGPFTHQGVVQMFTAGTLSGTDLVWREGLTEWIPLATFLGIAPTLTLPRVAPAPKAAPPPVTPPVHVTTGSQPLPAAPGIGRCAYAAWLLVMCFVLGMFASIDKDASTTANGFAGIASLILFAQRLRNMGYSGWWALPLAFVPLLNLLSGFLCLIAPPRYAQTRKLDPGAKVFLLLLVALIVLIAFIASQN